MGMSLISIPNLKTRMIVMKKSVLWLGLALCVGMWSCEEKDNVSASKTVDSDFEQGADGWAADFAEYSKVQEIEMFEFKAEVATLPTALGGTKKAFRVQSHNRSDDVFMFMKKKVTGLKPNTTYKVSYEIDLGTNYWNNSVGIGGSPAESVYLKAGGATEEPVKKLVDDYYEVTIKKGQQATGGPEMPVIGNVSNGVDEQVYKLVKRSTENPVAVKTNANGELWLCVGTDSGFEGLTVLYYDRIKATIKE